MVGDWKIQYPLSLRLKGTMTSGRFNLIPHERSGLEPTVTSDICESAVLNHFAIKAFCTSRNNNWIQLLFCEVQKCFYCKMVKQCALTPSTSLFVSFLSFCFFSSQSAFLLLLLFSVGILVANNFYFIHNRTFLGVVRESLVGAHSPPTTKTETSVRE